MRFCCLRYLAVCLYILLASVPPALAQPYVEEFDNFPYYFYSSFYSAGSGGSIDNGTLLYELNSTSPNNAYTAIYSQRKVESMSAHLMVEASSVIAQGSSMEGKIQSRFFNDTANYSETGSQEGDVEVHVGFEFGSGQFGVANYCFYRMDSSNQRQPYLILNGQSCADFTLAVEKDVYYEFSASFDSTLSTVTVSADQETYDIVIPGTIYSSYVFHSVWGVGRSNVTGQLRVDNLALGPWTEDFNHPDEILENPPNFQMTQILSSTLTAEPVGGRLKVTAEYVNSLDGNVSIRHGKPLNYVETTLMLDDSSYTTGSGSVGTLLFTQIFNSLQDGGPGTLRGDVQTFIQIIKSTNEGIVACYGARRKDNDAGNLHTEFTRDGSGCTHWMTIPQANKDYRMGTGVDQSTGVLTLLFDKEIALLGTDLPVYEPRNKLAGPQIYARRSEGKAVAEFEYIKTEPTVAAVLTGPVTNKALTGPAITFTWKDTSSETQIWWLEVGSSRGAKNYHDSGALQTLSRTVTGLPTDGREVFVRLWHNDGNGWDYMDANYISGPPGLPALSTPVPGASLSGEDVYFAWNSGGLNVSNWWLYVGSSQGAFDYHSSGDLQTNQSTVVKNLPGTGEELYVTLWYKLVGETRWQSISNAVTAYTGEIPDAPLLIGPSGVIPSNVPLFEWDSLPEATWYQLYVRDSANTITSPWYRAVDVNCLAAQTICSALSPVTIVNNGLFWVRAWNASGGYGPWSSSLSFEVP